MRVAVRRLRAFLKTAEDALEPAWRDDLRTRLKWLGGELGPVRDLDVLTDRLRDEAVPRRARGPRHGPSCRRLEKDASRPARP